MKLINNANCLLFVFSAGLTFSSFGFRSVAFELQSKALFNHRSSVFSTSLAQQPAYFSRFESKQSLALKTEASTHRQPANDEPKIPADAGGSR